MSNANKPQPPKNAATTSAVNTPTPWTKSLPRAVAVTMLVLSLCCAGCAHKLPNAAVASLPTGNAVLVELPPGTLLTLPGNREQAYVRSLFPNEVEEAPGAGLRLRSALRLATPAYIADRDQRELMLLQVIEELRVK